MNGEGDSEEEIYHQALALAEGKERDAFLDQACGESGDLRRQIEELIEAHEQPASFFGETQDGEPGDGNGQAALLREEKPGDRFGAYELIEKIGSGGMGTIWRAKQHGSITREVALKIIKLGMDTGEVVRRFQAERQALAMMDHPSIAKIHDAGATDKGRPFFVMELVEGCPLTDYCDEHRLSTRERLRLFMDVCLAVQHAHQKGVIHRDIKPSNILVTQHDGKPVAKVIDFGVAKAVEEKITGETFVTRLGRVIGTLGYMSPEQANGEENIDTRSDVYSLGVVLYELLSGQLPFGPAMLQNLAFQEVLKVIREEEPLKPSTCLTGLGQSGKMVAARRSTWLGKLARTVKGDLDWIVMRALEKDRAHRYETANALALDIERFLNEEAVAAGPPSTGYRMRKFVRRHRWPVAFATTVVVLLIAGITATIRLAIRESESAARERNTAALAMTQEANARQEAATSREVARFFREMLEGIEPSVALGRDTTILREILQRTTERVDFDLKDQPAVAVEIKLTLGHVYIELNEFETAVAIYKEALYLARSALAEKHRLLPEAHRGLAAALLLQGKYPEAEKLARQAVNVGRSMPENKNLHLSESLDTLVDVLGNRDKYEEAETLSRETLAIRQQLYSEADSPEIASGLLGLAGILRNRNKYEEAEKLTRQALEMWHRRVDGDHPGIAASLRSLALISRARGKHGEAEKLHQQVLAMRKKIYGEEDTMVASSLCDLASGYCDEARFEEAESLYKQALNMRKKLLRKDHPRIAETLYSLADILIKQGRLREAEVPLREALAIRERCFGKEHPFVSETLGWLAHVLGESRKYSEAEKLWRRKMAIDRERIGEETESYTMTLHNFAGVLDHLGRPDEAEQTYRKVLDIRRKILAPQHLDIAKSLNGLGKVLIDLKRFPEAEKVHREALEMKTALLSESHSSVAISLNNLGRSLQAQEKYSEAEVVLRKSLALKRELQGENHPRLATTHNNLGSNLQDQGKLGEAEQEYRKALTIARANYDETHPFVHAPLTNLQRLLRSQGKIDAAETLILESLRLKSTAFGEGTAGAVAAEVKLFEHYQATGDIGETRKVVERLLEMKALHEESTVAYGVARYLVAMGSLTQHENLCRRILEKAEGTDHIETATSAALSLILRPNAPKDLYAKATVLAQFAVDLRPVDRAFLSILGLAKLREGKNEEAESALKLALTYQHSPSLSLTHAALAISNHQQGHMERAKAALARAEFSLGSAVFVSSALTAAADCPDGYLEAWLMVREARRLIAGKDAYDLTDDPTVVQVIIPPDSEWRWLHPTDGVDPGDSIPNFHSRFSLIDFDDKAWEMGKDHPAPRGGFAYGEHPFRGVDIGAPANKAHRLSAYFRHKFTLPAGKTFAHLELRCQFDDGVVIYLDGKELSRHNVGEGADAYELPATTAVATKAEHLIRRFRMKDYRLEAGEHILAISLHNVAGGSSDLRLAGVCLVEIEPGE